MLEFNKNPGCRIKAGSDDDKQEVAERKQSPPSEAGSESRTGEMEMRALRPTLMCPRSIEYVSSI
ncbi:hypothetical protein NQZ68_035005 [Dissostichus eleginoides]|nr:hypothetical protein NQZ68_035005 [Dissostichus eleginoides]